MEQTKFKITHIDQTLADFQKDIHRFVVECEGKTYNASCVGALTINLEGMVPNNLSNQIMDEIWRMIDTYENTDAWPVPEGAQKIADDYCKEEFCQEVSE